VFINLEFDANALAAPQSFRDGIQAAANIIDASFVDPITINIAVGEELTAGVTSDSLPALPASLSVGFTTLAGIESAFAKTASSVDDRAVLANLSAYKPSSEFPISQIVWSAQAKALGLISPTDSALDGHVLLSPSLSGSALIDVALRELTDAMGRHNGGMLDLIRYDSPGKLTIDTTIVSSSSTGYLSFDGGRTSVASLAANNGHDFASPAGDPFDAATGNAAGLTTLDLRLMDVIGFTRPRLAGRAPESSFDPDYYLTNYQDIAAAGIDAQTHYDTTGWREGRNPNALFDTNYYLAHNPDVAQAGIDPFLHYEQIGWREGRDPGPNFSTSSYLAHNTDVKLAGINPLDHYLLTGINEHRSL
jgi:hypothetical protein